MSGAENPRAPLTRSDRLFPPTLPAVFRPRASILRSVRPPLGPRPRADAPARSPSLSNLRRRRVRALPPLGVRPRRRPARAGRRVLPRQVLGRRAPDVGGRRARLRRRRVRESLHARREAPGGRGRDGGVERRGGDTAEIARGRPGGARASRRVARSRGHPSVPLLVSSRLAASARRRLFSPRHLTASASRFLPRASREPCPRSGTCLCPRCAGCYIAREGGGGACGGVWRRNVGDRLFPVAFGARLGGGAGTTTTTRVASIARARVRVR